MARTALAVVALVLVGACGSDDNRAGPSSPSTTGPSAETRSTAVPAPTGGTEPASLTVEVVSTVPHDTSSFTQGLVRIGDGFYESTGLYGESALIEVADDGGVRQRVDLDDALFGEGLELVGDELVQLTYREGTALVYDSDTFAEVDRFTYDGEGWGLCLLDGELIMSDGTAVLTRRDSDTFATIDTVPVTLADQPLMRLNELECVDGTVWANVWQQDIVVGIDPATGGVHSVVDASDLLDPATRSSEAVLNGIAHDEGAGTFWLTGKYWPTVFEVRFVPAA